MKKLLIAFIFLFLSSSLFSQIFIENGNEDYKKLLNIIQNDITKEISDSYVIKTEKLDSTISCTLKIPYFYNFESFSQKIDSIFINYSKLDVIQPWKIIEPSSLRTKGWALIPKNIGQSYVILLTFKEYNQELKIIISQL